MTTRTARSPAARYSRRPAECIVGRCHGFGLVYRRISVRSAVMLVRVCHRHASLFT